MASETALIRWALVMPLQTKHGLDRFDGHLPADKVWPLAARRRPLVDLPPRREPTSLATSACPAGGPMGPDTVAVMDPNALAAIVAAAAAILSVLVSIVFGALNARSANRSAVAAEEAQRLAGRQLEAGVSATEQALQPYLWADLRPRADGSLLVLHIGNSGPTVATRVRVLLEPPLADLAEEERRDRMTATGAALASGLTSLAPGRTLEWTLGRAGVLVPADKPAPAVRVTIDADGPYGLLPTLVYVIDLEQVKYSSGRGEGLGLIERAINSVAQEAKQLHQTVRSLGDSG